MAAESSTNQHRANCCGVATKLGAADTASSWGPRGSARGRRRPDWIAVLLALDL
jgi:hypothetical protein